MRYLFFLLPFILACGEEYGGYNNGFDVPPGYSQAIHPDAETSSGILVDTSGYRLDLAVLDGRIAKIETCILEVMGSNPSPRDDWKCLPSQYKNEPLKREYLLIKLVVPIYSKCSDWQLLPIPAPDELCESKGIAPTPQCPCRWRTAIQDENIILTPPPETRPGIPPTTPPAPYLWELGRMMTSCNNVWASPFSKCLSY